MGGANRSQGRPPSSSRVLEKDVAFSCADQNNFNGTLEDTISANTSLEGIYLGTNNLSGQIPASLGNARRLLYLDLSENQFSGGIPASLGSIRSLTTFSVRANQLTGSAPLQLANPPPSATLLSLSSFFLRANHAGSQNQRT